MPDPIKTLIEISPAPSDKEAFESWLTGQDAIVFLKDNAQQDQFIVYAGA